MNNNFIASKNMYANYVLLFMCILFGTSAYANDDRLFFALAGYDIESNAKPMLQTEYHFDKNWSVFKPLLGLFVTSESSFYLYAGVRYPIAINPSWYFTPSLSAGGYHEGAGDDLGHVLEFYSQLRLEYKIKENSLVGLGISHISNAGLDDKNPGANMAYFHYSTRFD